MEIVFNISTWCRVRQLKLLWWKLMIFYLISYLNYLGTCLIFISQNWFSFKWHMNLFTFIKIMNTFCFLINFIEFHKKFHHNSLHCLAWHHVLKTIFIFQTWIPSVSYLTIDWFWQKLISNTSSLKVNLSIIWKLNKNSTLVFSSFWIFFQSISYFFRRLSSDCKIYFHVENTFFKKTTTKFSYCIKSSSAQQHGVQCTVNKIKSKQWFSDRQTQNNV